MRGQSKLLTKIIFSDKAFSHFVPPFCHNMIRKISTQIDDFCMI